jgi:cyclopropane fatty-acyl-phospholipid synthase-like methyltransferase
MSPAPFLFMRPIANGFTFFFKKANLQPGDKFLDIGCGSNWAALAARDYGLEVWGCDIDVF